MNKLKIYLAELRAPFFTASIVPVILGAAIAWQKYPDNFQWRLFILTLLGGILLHAGANVANDYYDHLSGTDEMNEEFVRPFTGGSRMIQTGIMTPREVLVESLVLYAIAAPIGIYLIWVAGPMILLLGIIGAFSGFFYCAPPFKLVHRGIGEIFIGLNFGILMTFGSYYVQARSFAWEPVAASLPVAFLITAVLYINEFQDEAADKAAGKKHLVARLGKAKAVYGYIAVMAAAYISIVLAVIAHLLTPWALLGLLAAPLAIKAIIVTRKNFDDSEALTPANALTVISHLVTGLALSAGYIITGFFS